MVVFGGGCELHHHRHTDMILHYRMNFHSSYLLSRFRMPADALEDVVEERYCGGVHHVEQLFPVFRLVRLPLIVLRWAAVR